MEKAKARVKEKLRKRLHRFRRRCSRRRVEVRGLHVGPDGRGRGSGADDAVSVRY